MILPIKCAMKTNDMEPHAKNQGYRISIFIPPKWAILKSNIKVSTIIDTHVTIIVIIKIRLDKGIIFSFSNFIQGNKYSNNTGIPSIKFLGFCTITLIMFGQKKIMQKIVIKAIKNAINELKHPVLFLDSIGLKKSLIPIYIFLNIFIIVFQPKTLI